MSELNFQDWVLKESKPNLFATPEELNKSEVHSIPAIVPGTVAQSLEANELWSIDKNKDFDASDWWYQSSFKSPDELAYPLEIEFSGLASLCEIWINNQLIHTSTNMFLPCSIKVGQYLQAENHIALCFRSLNEHLKQKRPRPRWKTKLVKNQQLRWVRTTLLGKIPGWSPPVSPVGPWQAIKFVSSDLRPFDTDFHQTVAGAVGSVQFEGKLAHSSGLVAKAFLLIDGVKTELAQVSTVYGSQLSGSIDINDVQLWWPHTHGKPNLYSVKLLIETGSEESIFNLPSLGFKQLELDNSGNRFEIAINKQPIFCRGACWTVNDIVSLTGSEENLRSSLLLMQQAGANMIRIGGTMIYEQDEFYQICDELGIMVWQDFMFANLDYPDADSEFTESVDLEVISQLKRFRKHVCISLYCGNSEIEQQVSMMGLPQDSWKNKIFDEILPQHCRQQHAAIPYISSTPTGGRLPFHTKKNVTHYYGVGAYQRPVSEVRSHAVKFTSEALGFSNIPVESTRNSILSGDLPVTHDPRWKSRVPRDSGTGWDFEDIRDHYLETLYQVNPVQLRYENPEKYIQLSELVTGEVVSQVFAEWRCSHSQCSGALVWFLKDLWPGAGWGIIDSNGMPKAIYYYLKRAWKSVNVQITDENINGLEVHVGNETNDAIQGSLRVTVVGQNSIVTMTETVDLELKRNSVIGLNIEELLGGFYDLNYSYRFGPRVYTAVIVELLVNDKVEDEAWYYAEQKQPQIIKEPEIEVIAYKTSDMLLEVTLESSQLLTAVELDIAGYLPQDNYFSLLPNQRKTILCTQLVDSTKRFKGFLSAINLAESVRIRLTDS